MEIFSIIKTLHIRNAIVAMIAIQITKNNKVLD